MTIVSVLLLFIWLVPIPMLVGGLFGRKYTGGREGIFKWVAGQIVLWAVFQLLAVPLILLKVSFEILTYLMVAVVLGTLLLRGGIFLVKKQWKREGIHPVQSDKGWGKQTCILAILFGGLLLLQLVLTVFLAYEEGDDAYYLAVATSTVDSNMMYTKLPYQGLQTTLDARHGLAPFPIWIAFLSRLTGMKTISLAQIALPVGLIVMTYAVHYLLAEKLFGKDREKCFLYLLLVEVLTIFGGHSSYTVESFLLVRISQGKAVLCNLILPFLVVLLFYYMQQLQDNKKTGGLFWILVYATALSGCLCSTQGGLLVCMILGMGALCGAWLYKSRKPLLPLGLGCLFPAMYLLLYLKLG